MHIIKTVMGVLENQTLLLHLGFIGFVYQQPQKICHMFWAGYYIPCTL